MKKVLSSVIACVAMIGLLSSCVEEQIKTTFEVDAAEATITVTVVNLGTGEDVTSVATISTSAGSVSGNKIILVGNNSISQTTVNVTASYVAPNGTYSTTEPVTVNALRAGGKAYYSVIINVGEVTPIGEYTFEVVDVEDGDPIDEITYFDKATIEEASKKWAHNESEYLLRGTVTYQTKVGKEVYQDGYRAEGWEEIVDKLVADFESTISLDIEDETADIVVSAWSYYTAWVTLTTQMWTKEFYAIDKMGNKTLIGDTGYFEYSSTYEYDEMASPSHASHYVAGHGVDDDPHGHGHGHSSGHGGDNAGGGIVLGD